MLFSYEATDRGLVRAVNEDSIAAFEPSVFVVADGMGGEAAGEVASRMLVQAVKRELNGQAGIGREELEMALQAANREILSAADNKPEYQGMGTTATLLHVDTGKNMAFWAHVGDSRLYLYRSGQMEQITEDHSYVAGLVAQGQITEAEARVHPQKNMLLRAVGVNRQLEVDTGSFELKSGDILLLATDGLMKQLADERIASFLSASDGDIAKKLVSEAVAMGGRDNVSVIVVVYKDGA